MTDIAQLKNIGTTVAARLNEIGVFTKAELKKLGSVNAYQQIQTNHPNAHLPVCYYLYSLEGALKNKDWRDFSEKQKLEMRKQAGLPK